MPETLTQTPEAQPVFTPPPVSNDPIKPVTPMPEDGMTLEQSLEAAFKSGSFDAEKPASRIPKALEAAKQATPESKKTNSPEATTPVDAAKVMQAATSPVSADMTDQQLDADIADATKGMGEKERNGFKKLRYEHREAQRELKKMASLTAELEAMKSAPLKTDDAAVQAVQRKVEELTAQIAEKENVLLATKAEHSDFYKTNFAAPLAQIDEQIKSVATEYTIDPVDIDRAMSLTGKARAEALSELAVEMPDFDRKAFYDSLLKRSEVLAKRNEFMDNAAENYKAMEAQQTERQKQATASRQSQWKDTLTKQWQESVLKDVPDLDPETVKAAQEFVTSTTFDQLDLPSQATAFQRAAAWPGLLNKARGLEAKVAQLEQRLAGYKGATPAAATGAPINGSSTDKNGIPDTASFEDALNIRMAQAGMGGRR